ncbi:MAG: DUF3597 domain-containing protein [Chloroflexi bacterium]|nr:DUF3597 domain-containing protein [Chloroflexota bacterium]
MGFFNTILEKLGLKKGKSAEASATPAPAAPVEKKAAVAPTATAKPHAPVMDKGEKDEPMAAAPKAISEVDVVSQLEKLAAGKELNWKVSIVDLLKLLDIDSSREARTELAKELNCPADMMSDSARMNTWLHKEVLRKVAANGGNIPKDLLD